MRGFFGRLKVEMFYGRSWAGWSMEEFMSEVDRYIHWYNERRIKTSHGGLSPVRYREKLDIAAWQTYGKMSASPSRKKKFIKNT